MGMSQEQLGEKADCSQGTVAAYEKGNFGKNPRALDAILRVLGLRRDEEVSTDDRELLADWHQVAPAVRRHLRALVVELAQLPEIEVAKTTDQAPSTTEGTTERAASARFDAQVIAFHGSHKRRTPPTYTADTDELVEVRQPLRVAAGGPGGWANVERTDDVLDVPRAALGRAKPRSRWAVEVRGDSMEPVVCDGCSVIVGGHAAAPGDLAVIEADGSAWVKWLEVDVDDYVLISENPTYRPVRVARLGAVARRVEAIISRGGDA